MKYLLILLTLGLINFPLKAQEPYTDTKSALLHYIYITKPDGPCIPCNLLKQSPYFKSTASIPLYTQDIPDVFYKATTVYPSIHVYDINHLYVKTYKGYDQCLRLLKEGY